MSEFFKCFGIAICIILADVAFCALMGFMSGISIEDDDWWIFPMIVNVLGFAIVTSILIAQGMS